MHPPPDAAGFGPGEELFGGPVTDLQQKRSVLGLRARMVHPPPDAGFGTGGEELFGAPVPDLQLFSVLGLLECASAFWR